MQQLHIQQSIAYMNICVHARSAAETQTTKKKCGHKIDHNSSSRPPFDIKNSALDRIFHARFIGNSFEC